MLGINKTQTVILLMALGGVLLTSLLVSASARPSPETASLSPRVEQRQSDRERVCPMSTAEQEVRKEGGYRIYKACKNDQYLTYLKMLGPVSGAKGAEIEASTGT